MIPSDYLIHSDTEIKGFFKDYFFLSNFFPCKVDYEGESFKSSEHAFQAAKTFTTPQWQKTDLSKLTSGEVKKWGKTVQLRPDWEKVKFDIMYRIVRSKFDINLDLRKRLLETKNKHLEELNHWKDTTWGVDVVSKSGLNWLGKILMNIRAEYILS